MMTVDLPRRRRRVDYNASLVGYLIMALVTGVVLWVLGPWVLGR